MVCACECGRCLKRPEASNAPGAGAIDALSCPTQVRESNLVPQQERCTFLAAESSLLLSLYCLKKRYKELKVVNQNRQGMGHTFVE